MFERGQGHQSSSERLLIRNIHTLNTNTKHRYVALLDSRGDLQSAVADADIAKDFVNKDFVREFESQIKSANVVIVDANLSEDTLSEIGKLSSKTCFGIKSALKGSMDQE